MAGWYNIMQLQGCREDDATLVVPVLIPIPDELTLTLTVT